MNIKMTDLFRKYGLIILLLLFIILGFYLRTYHLDYPTIGYHNVKEGEYLGMAVNMYNNGNYFAMENFWNGLKEHSYFSESETPLLVWFIVFAWKIFGMQLSVARLIIVLFTVATIPLIYLIGNQLTNNKEISLIASLLFTIMPSSVFFGRNIQPESPVLFFMLLFIFYFIKWSETQEMKYWIYFSIFFMITSLLKLPNLIGLFTLIFLIPSQYFSIEYLKMNMKKILKLIGIFLLINIFYPLWMLISRFTMPSNTAIKSIMKSLGLQILSLNYWVTSWPILASYIKDNFTWNYVFLALIGLSFCAIKRKNKFSRFIFGYLIGFLVFILILGNKWNHHSYYQFPFIPLIAFLSAYAIYNIGSFISQITKLKSLRYLSLIIILLIIGSVQASTKVQFDTLPGLGSDLAGEYINLKSQSNERVFYESQGQTDWSWHLQRFYAQPPNNLTKFKYGENEKNFKWVVLMKNGLLTIKNKKEVWKYIQENYEIKQLGLQKISDKLTLIYIVMHKGGTYNLTEFETKPPKLIKTYDTTRGNIEFYVIDA